MTIRIARSCLRETKRRAFVACACVALLMMTVETVPNPVDDASSLRESQIQWGLAWAARNPDSILAHYSPQAVLYIPGDATIEGRNVFEPVSRATASNPNSPHSWTVDWVRVGGARDVGVVRGRYVQHNPTPDGRSYTVETGHYVTTFERRGERWLAIQEM